MRIRDMTDGQFAEYMGPAATNEDARQFRDWLFSDARNRDKSPDDYSESEWIHLLFLFCDQRDAEQTEAAWQQAYATEPEPREF